MPPYGHLTIYSSPRVMLVHLAPYVIPLELRVTRQEVSQELISLGDCLVVLLLGFLEHLLGLLDLQLAGLHVIIGRDGSLDLAAFRRSLNIPVSFTAGFPSFLHCMLRPFCLMMRRTAMMWQGIPWLWGSAQNWQKFQIPYLTPKNVQTC